MSTMATARSKITGGVKMEKLRLGRTVLMATRVGFGGIPIHRLAEADAIEVVRKVLFPF